MKAVVLAAGRGRRLGDRAGPKNKCMLDVAGRPILEHVLDASSRCTNLAEIILVIGYRGHDIQKGFGNAHRGRPIRYVQQTTPSGLVDAIECAAPALQGEDFVLFLGDELMVDPRPEQLVDDFLRRDLFALCGVVEVDDPSQVKRTYTVQHDENGTILRLVEKPQTPFNRLMGTGVCVFKHAMLTFIAATPTNPERQERELPAWIQSAVDAGHAVGSAPVCRRYFNLNSERELREIHAWFQR